MVLPWRAGTNPAHLDKHRIAAGQTHTQNIAACTLARSLSLFRGLCRKKEVRESPPNAAYSIMRRPLKVVFHFQKTAFHIHSRPATRPVQFRSRKVPRFGLIWLPLGGGSNGGHLIPFG